MVVTVESESQLKGFVTGLVTEAISIGINFF